MENEKKEKTFKMSKSYIIITALYTIMIALPTLITCILLFTSDSLSYVFNTGDLFIVLRVLLIFVVILLPYILLVVSLKKKNSGLLKGTIIYELVLLIIGVAYFIIVWLAWPSIKSNINNDNCDWCNISTYDDRK